jgi:hypothetical protein
MLGTEVLVVVEELWWKGVLEVECRVDLVVEVGEWVTVLI